MFIWLLNLTGKKAWRQPDVASKHKFVSKRATLIPPEFQQALYSPEPVGNSATCILIKLTITKTYTHSNLYIIQEERQTFPHLTSDFESKVTVVG